MYNMEERDSLWNQILSIFLVSQLVLVQFRLHLGGLQPVAQMLSDLTSQLPHFKDEYTTFFHHFPTKSPPFSSFQV